VKPWRPFSQGRFVLLRAALSPVSVRQQIFVGVCLTFLLCYVLGSMLEVPFVLVAPLGMVLVHLLLTRRMDRPIRALLQITRQGGFDLSGPQRIVEGRDEFSRVARAVYGMARRMRKSMVEARDQNTRIEEIFSAIGEGVMIVSLEGKILKINNTVRRWVGWYGDVAGRDVTDVLRSVELAQKLQEMAEASKDPGLTGHIEPEMLESLHIEGPEMRKLRAKIVALQDDPENSAFLVFLFDVTDMHRLEQFRREFFANVSHELKTPIAAIRGYAEIAQSLPGVVGDETATHFLQVIERNTGQLTKLIDEMLMLAGLESGTLTLHLKPYDIRAGAQQVIETVLPKAADAGVRIELDIAPGIETMIVDAHRFNSVLLNLIDNGIKYNKPGGYVKLSVRENKTHDLVYVEDSGLGLPDAAQLRAFERFYRVDKAHTRLGGGSGLGLAIVKHVVQAHGGTISLRSELGVGTVFTVALPKAPTQKRISLLAPL